ncbi:hypothetical protein RCL_jg13299.t1 [Rhizophagus clarus]|uniref:Uncharacterized protein n=1 Tax=Rhizophagus clarus TaxID=94130 RepID=A0A8H3QSU2_9GLOM|nr:hypothetical protein RCL_jg13299.t1 [Rhizophagus clarus]
MDFSTQETIHSDPQWFFKNCKDKAIGSIDLAVKGIMIQNKDFFNQVEMDDDLLKQFLCSNPDVMQTVEIPTYIEVKPKSFLLPSFIATSTSQPEQHQSDSMNLDDSSGDTSIPSRPSPEQTPSGSKVVTFNNVPPQQATSLKSSDNNKPSEQSTITQDKKRKQEHLADNFNNANFILTGYSLQQEEQAQLLIPNHECLKAYNRGEWTIELGDIPLGFKKRPPARFDNAGNINTRQSKPSRQQDTNSYFSDNHKCHN